VLGGVGFAVSAALSAGAFGLWTLLAALVIGSPAVSAFVSLAQVTLIDLAPGQRERNMLSGPGSAGVPRSPLSPRLRSP
jgi:predicted MFS family arabinose efflux permease